jgi:integrase
MKRKEEPVRNNPGVYKRFEFDQNKSRWIETGKYRAVRHTKQNGEVRREQAVFDSLEEAKAFRSGLTEKERGGPIAHKFPSDRPDEEYLFQHLVEEWKSLHYLQIEYTSQQMYEARLPHLEPLHNVPVDGIKTNVITGLIKHWLSDDYHKPKDRKSFEKELDLLKVILNFYRRHKNNNYFLPILSEHYRAADFKKEQKAPVRGLREADVSRFLAVLKKDYSRFYPIALLQIGLGLRIGEALGMQWDDFDLVRREVNVERNIAWNKETRELFSKKRKNAKVLEAVLPEFLVPVLMDLFKNRDPKMAYLFHRNGELLRRQQVSKIYNRVLKQLNIEGVSGTHMLRKTAGTLARKLTSDVYAASKLLDHSSVNITEKYYLEELDHDKRKVADALNSVLVGVENPPDISGKIAATSSCEPLITPKFNFPKLTLVKSTS